MLVPLAALAHLAQLQDKVKWRVMTNNLHVQASFFLLVQCTVCRQMQTQASEQLTDKGLRLDQKRTIW